MITLIEAKNFRCLRYIRQPLDRFHVLVGPNASGKTTFLDVIAFLGDLVSGGLEKALYERTANFKDLTWGGEGNGFELAIEVAIPGDRRNLLKDKDFETVRYEVSLEINSKSGEIEIKAERVVLKKHSLNLKPDVNIQRSLFPMFNDLPDTIISSKSKKIESRTVVTKGSQGNDNFYSEVHSEPGKGWAPSFKLGPRKSALGNLPEDESKFPVTTWLKKFLDEGIQKIILNSLLIRKASPPGQVRGFKPDGSNLPWVINDLRQKHLENFNNWIAHLRTALPDIEDIKTIERPEDKHRYLVLKYRGGLEVPSWMASDGTLRLLALTLPAYLPGLTGVYLIEEPENGIHPRAVETAFQSLSSVYQTQVLLATHSPLILSMVDADKVLCFAKTEIGETDIVRGSDHPKLREWKGETNLGNSLPGVYWDE
ncbi:MAG: ATP-binding protein [Acidobacteria bacterium]|jgi:predicted ATPase|nr:ATP-binding protein [Acidobacteriota bacterium]